jgi:WD40 repeat protein
MRRCCWLLVWLALPALSGGWAVAQEKSDRPILVLDTGGHTDSITRVLFTPDGKQLISVSKDKTIRIWDVGSGELRRTLRPPIGPGRAGTLYAAALSPDGEVLAVGGIGREANQGRIYLIRLSTGRIEHVLQGHPGTVIGLAFSPDGKRLASGGDDQTVRLWDARSGEFLSTGRGHTGAIYDVAFAPDGRRLVTAALDGTARIWDAGTGESQAVLKEANEGQSFRCISAAWSPDGKTVAIGSSDQYLRLWRADGTLSTRFGPLGDSVRSLTFTTDSRAILVALGYDRRSDCFLLDLSNGKDRARFLRHQSGAWRGTLSPDGQLAATSGFLAEELYLWKTATGDVVHRLGGQGRSTWSSAWSPDGKSVAWGNTGYRSYHNERHPLERTFSLVDLELGGAPGGFRRAETVRGKLALERSAGDTVTVQEKSQPVATLRLSNEPPTCFTFLSDDRVAVGAFFGVHLFAARTGKLLRSFRGHTGDVWAVAPSPDGRYLLSASNDQTLRVWNPEQDEPLLSLFFAGNDWIAWTAEGYYAASPGGERLMGWQVNNGPDKLGSFYPAAQFRKSLYRPDVIKRLLETGSVEKALALADKARGKNSERAEVEQVLPPRVKITRPATGSKVTKDEVRVEAVAESVGKHPVTALHLLLDGRPYQGQAGTRRVANPKLGEVREEWTVSLSPGRHKLAVGADSDVSHGLFEEIEIAYAGEENPKVDLPRLYILAIGVAKYRDETLRLNYGARDAEAVAAAFKENSKALFQKIEVKLLTDKDATRAEILKGLGWLRQQMTQRDFGIVFFSGHGERDSDGSLYLLPADADPADLLSTCVPADQLKKTLVALPGKVIALLDACHSGGIDSGKRKAAAPLTDDLVRDLVSDENGLVVLCSSTGREFSLEDNEHRLGTFTVALVEGLSGKASKGTDGAVYLHHLDAYVTDRVKELTKGRQHPVTAKPASLRSFPLAKP